MKTKKLANKERKLERISNRVKCAKVDAFLAKAGIPSVAVIIRQLPNVDFDTQLVLITGLGRLFYHVNRL